jgi:hypothetical protein
MYGTRQTFPTQVLRFYSSSFIFDQNVSSKNSAPSSTICRYLLRSGGGLEPSMVELQQGVFQFISEIHSPDVLLEIKVGTVAYCLSFSLSLLVVVCVCGFFACRFMCQNIPEKKRLESKASSVGRCSWRWRS